MNQLATHICSLVTFFPLAGALFVAGFPKEEKGAIRVTALIFATVNFLLSLYLLQAFVPENGGMQFEYSAPWIPSFGITYHMGVDGISLFLILLTTFLTPIVILSAFHAIENRAKEYMINMLVLETAMLGALMALDLVLFYVFWELMLIPMYFLIGVFGGPRRIYATIKFFIYTMVGSLLMLAAILFIVWVLKDSGNQVSFDLPYLMSKLDLTDYGSAERFCFFAFALAFAIKVPMFPFHTWLPDAHVEAPTGGSVILAAVLLKMGTYGFLRFALPLFPRVAVLALELIAVLAVIGIIYGALVAVVQKDVKKLVAYSSVSHLGFVMLGIAALNVIGIQGAVYQMLNHGISTGALFLLVGVIYERRHTRMISDFGGLARVMPAFATVFLIICLSSIGVPGLNGFVGEFLIMAGAFRSELLPNAGIYTALAATGVIFAAVYLLWMYQRVMFGPVVHDENRRLHDLHIREYFVLVPLTVLAIGMGLFPKPFLDRMEPAVEALVKHVDAKGGFVVRQVDSGATGTEEEKRWAANQVRAKGLEP